MPSFGDIYGNCFKNASLAVSALNRTPQAEVQ